MTQAIQRKEKEIAAIAAKMEDEQSLGGKMHKQVKELSVSELERFNINLLSLFFIFHSQRTDNLDSIFHNIS